MNLIRNLLKIKHLASWHLSFSATKATALVVVACFFISSVCRDVSAVAAMPAVDATQYKQIFNDFILPYSYGKINKSHFAGTDRVIINIQDLHCHPKVQKNISNIIEIFDKKYGISNIYLEGAYGNVSTKWLTENVNNNNGKNEILNKILETGKLTGAEYYSATSNKTEIIKGLEKKGPYLDNLKRFGDLLEKQNEVQLILKGIEESTAEVKKQYYTRRQYKIEELSEKYISGQIKAEKYYNLLSKHLEKLAIDLTKYENTALYIRLLALQKQLNYKAVAGQLQELILVLKGKLPYNTYKMLLDNTKNFEQTDKLYSYIIKLSKDFGLDVTSKFNELNKYFTIIELSQKINPLELIKEEERLTREINTRFADTVAQREVVFLTHFEKYLKDYLSTKITSDDYEYYKENIETYKRLYNKYADNKILSLLKPYMEETDKFYEINMARNNYFTENLFNGIKTEKISDIKEENSEVNKIIENMDKVKKVDVIITGGFHSQTVTDILQKEGVSYIVITPNVKGGVQEAEETYHQLAKEQKEIDFQTIATAIASLNPAQQKELLQYSKYDTIEQLQKAIENPQIAESLVKQLSAAKFLESDDVVEGEDYEDYKKAVQNLVETLVGKEVSEETINKIVENNTEDIFSNLKNLRNIVSLYEQGVIKGATVVAEEPISNIEEAVTDIVVDLLNIFIPEETVEKEEKQDSAIKEGKQLTDFSLEDDFEKIYRLSTILLKEKPEIVEILIESENNRLSRIKSDLRKEKRNLRLRENELQKENDVQKQEDIKEDIKNIKENIEKIEEDIKKIPSRISSLKEGEKAEGFNDAYHEAFEYFLMEIASGKKGEVDELKKTLLQDSEGFMELAKQYHNNSYFAPQKYKIDSGRHEEGMANLDMRLSYKSYNGDDKLVINQNGKTIEYKEYFKDQIANNKDFYISLLSSNIKNIKEIRDDLEEIKKGSKNWDEIDDETKNKIKTTLGLETIDDVYKLSNEDINEIIKGLNYSITIYNEELDAEKIEELITNPKEENIAQLSTLLFLAHFNWDTQLMLNYRGSRLGFGRKVFANNIRDDMDGFQKNLESLLSLAGKNGVAAERDSNGLYILKDGTKVSELKKGEVYKVEKNTDKIKKEDIIPKDDDGKDDLSVQLGNTFVMSGEDIGKLINEDWESEEVQESVKDGFKGNQINGIISVLVVIFDVLKHPKNYYLKDENGNEIKINGRNKFNILMILLCIHSAWSLDNPWSWDLAHLQFPEDLVMNYDGTLSIVETMKDGDQLKFLYAVKTTAKTMGEGLASLHEMFNGLNLFSDEQKVIIEQITDDLDEFDKAVNKSLRGIAEERDKEIIKEQNLKYVKNENTLKEDIAKEFNLNVIEDRDTINGILKISENIDGGLEKTIEYLQNAIKYDVRKEQGYNTFTWGYFTGIKKEKTVKNIVKLCTRLENEDNIEKILKLFSNVKIPLNAVTMQKLVLYLNSDRDNFKKLSSEWKLKPFSISEVGVLAENTSELLKFLNSNYIGSNVIDLFAEKDTIVKKNLRLTEQTNTFIGKRKPEVAKINYLEDSEFVDEENAEIVFKYLENDKSKDTIKLLNKEGFEKNIQKALIIFLAKNDIFLKESDDLSPCKDLGIDYIEKTFEQKLTSDKDKRKLFIDILNGEVTLGNVADNTGSNRPMGSIFAGRTGSGFVNIIAAPVIETVLFLAVPVIMAASIASVVGFAAPIMIVLLATFALPFFQLHFGTIKDGKDVIITTKQQVNEFENAKNEYGNKINRKDVIHDNELKSLEDLKLPKSIKNLIKKQIGAENIKIDIASVRVIGFYAILFPAIFLVSFSGILGPLFLGNMIAGAAIAGLAHIGINFVIAAFIDGSAVYSLPPHGSLKLIYRLSRVTAPYASFVTDLIGKIKNKKDDETEIAVETYEGIEKVIEKSSNENVKQIVSKYLNEMKGTTNYEEKNEKLDKMYSNICAELNKEVKKEYFNINDSMKINILEKKFKFIMEEIGIKDEKVLENSTSILFSNSYFMIIDFTDFNESDNKNNYRTVNNKFFDKQKVIKITEDNYKYYDDNPENRPFEYDPNHTKQNENTIGGYLLYELLGYGADTTADTLDEGYNKFVRVLLPKFDKDEIKIDEITDNTIKFTYDNKTFSLSYDKEQIDNSTLKKLKEQAAVVKSQESIDDNNITKVSVTTIDEVFKLMTPSYLANLVANGLNDKIQPGETILWATKDNAEVVAKYLEKLKNKGEAGRVLVVETNEKGEIFVEQTLVKRGGYLINDKIRLNIKQTDNNIYSVSAYTKFGNQKLTMDELKEKVSEKFTSTTNVDLTDGTSDMNVMDDKLKNAIISDEYNSEIEVELDLSEKENIDIDTDLNINTLKQKEVDRVFVTEEQYNELSEKETLMKELANNNISIGVIYTVKDTKDIDNIYKKTNGFSTNEIIKIDESVGDIFKLLSYAYNKNILCNLTLEQHKKVKANAKDNNLKYSLLIDKSDGQVEIEEILNNDGSIVGISTSDINNLETLRTELGKNIGQVFAGIKDAIRVISKTIARTPTQKYERTKDTILKTKANLGKINTLDASKILEELNNKDSALYKLLTKDASKLTQEDSNELEKLIKEILANSIFTDDVNNHLDTLNVFESFGALRAYTQLAMQEIVLDHLSLVISAESAEDKEKAKKGIINQLNGEYSQLRDYLTIEMIKLAMTGEDVSKIFDDAQFDYGNNLTLKALENMIKEKEGEILAESRFKIDPANNPATLENTKYIFDAIDLGLPEAKVGDKSINVIATNATRSMLAAA